MSFALVIDSGVCAGHPVSSKSTSRRIGSQYE